MLLVVKGLPKKEIESSVPPSERDASLLVLSPKQEKSSGVTPLPVLTSSRHRSGMGWLFLVSSIDKERKVSEFTKRRIRVHWLS